jgi:hypothetical protein
MTKYYYLDYKARCIYISAIDIFSLSLFPSLSQNVKALRVREE